MLKSEAATPVQDKQVQPVGASANSEGQAVDGEAVSPCPNCGAPMNGIRGSKSAICANCGFKDSCCF